MKERYTTYANCGCGAKYRLDYLKFSAYRLNELEIMMIGDKMIEGRDIKISKLNKKVCDDCKNISRRANE